MNKIYAIFLIFALFNCNAQIYVNRNVIYNTEDTAKKRTFLERTFYSAEVNRGTGSTDEEQAWNIKFAGWLKVFNSQKHTIILSLSQELNANPYNPITFNPRGAIWNEDLFYMRKIKLIKPGGGFSHRCRHDIDNAQYSDVNKPNPPGFIPTQRTLVYTSMFYSVLLPEFRITDNLKINIFFRTDYKIYSEDDRRPYGNFEIDWEKIKFCTFSLANLVYSVSSRVKFYNQCWANILYFDSHDAFQANYRVEGGLCFLVHENNIQIYFASEKWFDDLATSYPRKSIGYYLGLRFIPK